MASTYVNNLRLNEMATGDGSGTWGTTTNTNLELIGQALGYGTRAIANASTDNITIADGASDSDRAMYLKLTGGGQACTVSLLPNTASKVWMMENATSYTLTFTCGSGANVAILAGETKIIATDGAGSGGVVYDVLTDTNLAGTTKTAALTNAGALSNQGTVTVGVDDTGYDVKFFGATSGAYMLWDESADDLKLVGAAGLTVAGNIDIDGTSNLDVVDIDGAVNMATTALVTGVLTTTAATVFNGGFASNADSTMGTDKKVQFRDAAIYINSSADGQLDLVADTEIQIAATTIDINGAINASGEIIAASLDISGNVDIDGVLETDNLTVGGAQGTDGQVLTSTGSGVGWEDAGGGPTFKEGGTDFANSIMVGDDGTGTLSSATGNTGLGKDVFEALTSGTDNVAVGFNALDALTSGANNTALGTESLGTVNTGHSNTAAGTNSGKLITTGAYNTLMGRNSGDAITSADSNTAVGWTSLGLTTTGAGNTAVGSDAGAAITTGANNVIMGYLAGDALTTGESSTFIGKSAGSSLTTSADNIAIGFGALDAANSASTSQCIVIGVDAAGGALAGYNNVFIGYTSALAATSAFENTSVGGKSLKALTTGDYNVCLGFEAGDAITSGSNNIIVGYQAGKSGSPGGAITTASNILSLGDENIATANIQVDWTVASDKRDKTDVESLNMGLDFINKLEPITYRWDKRSKYSDDQSVTPDGAHKEEQLDVGFLAQDVEALEKEYGYDFDNKTNLTTQLSEDNQMYGLKYSKFVPMLVKSIQELTTQVEMLKTEVATLKGE